MDFSSLIVASIIDFFQNNPFITFCVAIFIAYLLYQRPKLVITIFFIIAILLAAIYLISYMSSFGVSYKKELLRGGMRQDI